MVYTIPDSLKTITPYIKRAEELEGNANPEFKIMAFYCKKYALEQTIKLKLSTPDANNFLKILLVDLEKEKATLSVSTEQGSTICFNFANSVFQRADDEDRAGASSKATAKIFYSAASFYDVLEQFGELDADIKDKRKYAKWKAADILNAIKEGRTPTAGSFDDATGKSASQSSTSPMNNFIPQAPQTNIPSLSAPFIAPSIDYTPPISQVSAMSMSTSQSHYQQPPMTSLNMPNIVHPSIPVYSNTNNRPSATSSGDPRVKDAMELCNFAIAAMKVNVSNLCNSFISFLYVNSIMKLI